MLNYRRRLEKGSSLNPEERSDAMIDARFFLLFLEEQGREPIDIDGEFFRAYVMEVILGRDFGAFIDRHRFLSCIAGLFEFLSLLEEEGELSFSQAKNIQASYEELGDHFLELHDDRAAFIKRALDLLGREKITPQEKEELSAIREYLRAANIIQGKEDLAIEMAKALEKAAKKHLA